MRQRLAESFETALRLGQMALRSSLHGRRRARTAPLLRQFACPICGYSLADSSRGCFVQQSAGACPTCDGLGVKQFFDPRAGRHAPRVSLAGGRGARLGPAQRLLLPAAPGPARYYSSTSRPPGRSCRRRTCTAAPVRQRRGARSSFRYFDGTRRYGPPAPRVRGHHSQPRASLQETDSAMVREELSKYLGTQPCPDCQRHALGPRTAPVFVDRPQHR